MINQYGADAVRWFILSDSPPEKDVQWSDSGVLSANKFLQKIWNLNIEIFKKKNNKSDKFKEEKFLLMINNFIVKIDDSINNFRFNVSIANFYEVYNFFKNYIDAEISRKVLEESIVKIMKLMMPFVPHISNECLELFNCKTTDKWPKIDRKNVLDEIKVAIQINGKTRDIMTAKKDLDEENLRKLVLNKSKAKKYLENKKVLKTIFVKNKIVNYILN